MVFLTFQNLNNIFLGTSLLYQPGLLVGGKLDHDCSLQRGIGYYLEALICLAPFTKTPLRAVLRGVTNDQTDPSVSCYRVWEKLFLLIYVA